MKYRMTTPATARKVKYAAVGAGVGDALATVLINAAESLLKADLSTEVETAVTVLVVALVAYVSGRVARPSPVDEIQPETPPYAAPYMGTGRYAPGQVKRRGMP